MMTFVQHYRALGLAGAKGLEPKKSQTIENNQAAVLACLICRCLQRKKAPHYRNTDLSELFSEYLTRFGIKKGRGLSLYSLRHTVTDALRRAGRFDHQIGLILGHERQTTTIIYGVLPQGNLDLRTELVASISYPGLSLYHLKPG